MATATATVIVRRVWQKNLAEEFDLINRCLNKWPLVSMDTEYPGTVFSLDIPKHEFSTLSPAQHYALMKQNVDALNIIQLGLTLFDSTSRDRYVWEFNFRDFDPDHDIHNPDSVALLRSRGIDFQQNTLKGIHTPSFAAHFLKSGLCTGLRVRAWVTFHGLYDFGFMIKVLTGKELPNHLGDFMMLMHCYLGMRVYDLKPIARSLALHGGLETVAKRLSLCRAVGKSHQAGSDSLLTMQVFLRLISNPAIFLQFNYLLYGLTCGF